MTVKTIIRYPGQPETVSVDSIQIPDLWPVAMLFFDAHQLYLKQKQVCEEHHADEEYPFNVNRVKIDIDGQQAKVVSEAILEVWHLTHDLLNALRAEEK